MQCFCKILSSSSLSLCDLEYDKSKDLIIIKQKLMHWSQTCLVMYAQKCCNENLCYWITYLERSKLSSCCCLNHILNQRLIFLIITIYVICIFWHYCLILDCSKNIHWEVNLLLALLCHNSFKIDSWKNNIIVDFVKVALSMCMFWNLLH